MKSENQRIVYVDRIEIIERLRAGSKSKGHTDQSPASTADRPDLPRVGSYTPHGRDSVIVGWVQPTVLNRFAVGCTDPTNGSPVPACGITPRGTSESFPIATDEARKSPFEKLTLLAEHHRSRRQKRRDLPIYVVADNTNPTRQRGIIANRRTSAASHRWNPRWRVGLVSERMIARHFLASSRAPSSRWPGLKNKGDGGENPPESSHWLSFSAVPGEDRESTQAQLALSPNSGPRPVLRPLGFALPKPLRRPADPNSRGRIANPS